VRLRRRHRLRGHVYDRGGRYGALEFLQEMVKIASDPETPLASKETYASMGRIFAMLMLVDVERDKLKAQPKPAPSPDPAPRANPVTVDNAAEETKAQRLLHEA
jgi:hypothetical protein